VATASGNAESFVRWLDRAAAARRRTLSRRLRAAAEKRQFDKGGGAGNLLKDREQVGRRNALPLVQIEPATGRPHRGRALPVCFLWYHSAQDANPHMPALRRPVTQITSRKTPRALSNKRCTSGVNGVSSAIRA